MKTTFAIKWLRSLVVVLATLFVTRTSGEELEAPGLAIAWADNYLAGETKEIRGKIYVVDADITALVKCYEQDFPEHVTSR